MSAQPQSNYYLYPVNDKNLGRCVRCLAIKNIMYKDSYKHRSFCLDCSNSLNIEKIKPGAKKIEIVPPVEVKVSLPPKIKEVKPKKEKPPTKAKTKLPKVKKERSLRGRRNHAIIPLLNDNAEYTLLTVVQHKVLLVLREPGMEIRDNYLNICAARLNKSISTVTKHCRILKEKGFKIPSEKERLQNLKNLVAQEMLSTDLPRSVFIRAVADEVKYSPSHIGKIVTQLEKEGMKIKRKSLTEKIADLLQDGAKTICQIQEFISEYPRTSICWAIKDLKSKKIIGSIPLTNIKEHGPRIKYYLCKQPQSK